MNDYTLIAVSFISGIIGLIGIQLLQHNWAKREQMKFNFDLKRAKIRKKQMPIKKSSTPSSASDWIDQLKKVNPDTLHELIDTFSGGGDQESGDIGDIIGTIVKNNPEVVEKFLGNVGKDNKTDQDKYI